MPAVTSLNPWSKVGGIEPQRSDLWVVSLEQALRYISALTSGGSGTGSPNGPTSDLFSSRSPSTGFAPFKEMSLPDKNSTRYYARQVIFPDVGMTEIESKTHTIPITYPGYDETIGGVRIDFLVEAGLSTSTNGALAPQLNSRILNLIRCWHQLARVGRPMRSSKESDSFIPLPKYPTLIGSTFKFDVKIQLFSGPDVDLTLRPDVNGLAITTSLTLRRCWVKSYQLSTLDYEGNGFLKLTVTFMPEAILPDLEVPQGEVTLGATQALATF